MDFGQVAKNFIKKLESKNISYKFSATSRDESEIRKFENKSIFNAYFYINFNCCREAKMNNTLTNKMLKLKTRPTGAVTSSHFELVEENVPDLEEGEILVKVLYLSFDPTQRGWLNDVKSYVHF